jgi:hypothetical protein
MRPQARPARVLTLWPALPTYRADDRLTGVVGGVAGIPPDQPAAALFGSL